MHTLSPQPPSPPAVSEALPWYLTNGTKTRGRCCFSFVRMFPRYGSQSAARPNCGFYCTPALLLSTPASLQRGDPETLHQYTAAHAFMKYFKYKLKSAIKCCLLFDVHYLTKTVYFKLSSKLHIFTSEWLRLVIFKEYTFFKEMTQIL